MWVFTFVACVQYPTPAIKQMIAFTNDGIIAIVFAIAHGYQQ